jgi:anti-sigma B factor antagonist
VNVVVGESSETHIHVAISGEVDADNCAEMGASLLQSGPSGAELVVDVSALAFIDSSGISELLRVREAMAEAGGSMVLRDPTNNVRRVLEITGLTDTFGL